MQSSRTISTDPPAEVALIKELVSTSEFKFLLPASQNKLLSIKQLSLWFITVSKMLSRFPDVDSFLFGTVASLNSKSELQLRTAKLEENGVKQEPVGPSKADLSTKIKEEMRLFGDVRTFARFDDFLDDTSHKKEIMESHDLQHLVAPTLFMPSVGVKALLSSAEQFRSPEYQETVILDENTGLTLVSDQRKFVFPTEQRITGVKAVTFHYVRGNRPPESRIHQLLRPLFWRWLTIALTGTDFAHLLHLGWECDHTWIFQRLVEQQEKEREESDQLFAILAVMDELRTKSPSVNLMTWYVAALKTINDLNAVTRTYRKGCGLMIIPVEMAEALYKVHAHREGYSEVMSRVSRENEGYMPILALQKAIANVTMDKNRQKKFSDFDSNKPKTKAITNQVAATEAKGNPVKIDCCYKFLEGKCQDANCKYPHLQMAVPAGVCSKYLADKKSCYGSCGKLHERWGNIIRKAHEGKLKISPAKARKPKEVKENAATSSQPTDSQDSESDSDSGGQGGKSETGGSQASAKPGPHPCTRCGKIGHEFSSCYSSTHFNGSWLTSPKPCPVPEEFWAVDQTWEARNGANKTKVNTMHAHIITPDQYMDNGTVFVEEAYWPTHQVNVLCSGSDADYDAEDALSLALKPDSLVIATEGSKICQ